MTRLVLGTRGSALALAQANWVRTALLELGAVHEIELEIIHTRGDKILDVPLAKVGGKGLFVKEIETALLDGRIDLAVHSLKDMPVEQPPGLVLAAFPEREDPRDRLVLHTADLCTGGSGDEPLSLKGDITVGTSSLRRVAQLKRIFPGVQVTSIRGNVGTRLGRLGEGVDGVVLAQAGLNRLSLAPSHGVALDPKDFVPAVGQGVLAIECRENDARTLGALAALDHGTTRTCVTAERAFLRSVEGSCQVPVGAFAHMSGPDIFEIDGIIASLDGARVVRGTRRGASAEAEILGAELGAELLERGGAELLEACLAAAVENPVT